MIRTSRLGLTSVLMLISARAAAANHCELKVFAQLPVTMEGLRPVVTAQINGVDTRFVADSGAWYSMLAPAVAAEYQLPTKAAPFGLFTTGVGGSTSVEIALVKTFTLAQYPINRVEFLIGGNDYGAGIAGLLGQNLIRLKDVEYDLANGALRLVKPENCGHNTLAYWATPSQAISEVDLLASTAREPQPRAEASINGIHITVGLDTGAAISTLSLAAAKRAGITPDSPGVKPRGFMMGVGRHVTRTWVAPVASFQIGDEQIKNTQLLIGDMNLEDTDMLLGDDFFLSHRVYIGYGEQKIYFTYNGGPVFRLDSPPPAAPPSSASGNPQPTQAPPPAAAAPPGSTAASSPTPAAPAGANLYTDEPTDAAGYMRRGTALAARKDYERALADLTRACELAPNEPEYFFERGRVRWQSGHPELALQDFNQTLQLQPDNIQALLARARLHLRERTGVKEDLDAVDHLAAPQDNLRRELGDLYGAIGEFAAATHQYDLWIEAHGNDVFLATVLNERCWSQAQAGSNLDRALKDCNQALHLQPNSPQFLDSRGLVYLRRGELDRAIADYNAALARSPRIAFSLYGRGLAKLRKGLKTDGDADLAAAKAVSPKIAEQFADIGLKP
jgi:tetratricopeptide (TPR) repeat protein